jgi:hypothetical protein
METLVFILGVYLLQDLARVLTGSLITDARTVKIVNVIIVAIALVLIALAVF